MFKDKDKDFSSKDNDKDFIVKDKDQDKDCILVLKESFRTRTRTNITVGLGLGPVLVLVESSDYRTFGLSIQNHTILLRINCYLQPLCFSFVHVFWRTIGLQVCLYKLASNKWTRCTTVER